MSRPDHEYTIERDGDKVAEVIDTMAHPDR